MMKRTDDGRHWKRMMFKANKVWVCTDAAGTPMAENGKVPVKYQLDQEHEYRVNEKSIRPIGPAPPGSASRGAKTPSSKKPPRLKETAHHDDMPMPENAVCVYTDGASSGNPGPAGIGVLLKYGEREKEISRYIGTATNNIAELEAIRTGLSQIRNRQLPVRVVTDSSYALGVLTLGWRPQKNRELIRSIQELISTFSDIRFVKVRGHAGHRENEIADRLAVAAIAARH